MTALEAHSRISTNYKDFGGFFEKEIQSHLVSCTSAEVATGYIGATLVESLTPSLIEIARRGHCKVLVGMIFNEGVTSTQKQVLEKLDESLRRANEDSGVFLTLRQFHGKVYRFKSADQDHIYVGSSNFSISGFKHNMEFNVRVTDQQTRESISSFLDFIFERNCSISAPLSDVELLIKGKRGKIEEENSLVSNDLSSCRISKEEFPSSIPISTIEIELRVDEQPKSSLNLFFDKGRKNQDGKYSPRPWYEVEVTSTTAERASKDYPLGEFDAYVSEGNLHYCIPMITASDNFKAIMSRGNRKILGELIKGKLEKLGHLAYGERITSDTLLEYGSSKLKLKKIADQKYLMDF